MLNSLGRDRLAAFAAAARLGFRVVHTGGLPESWLTGPERAEYIRTARASGLAVATMFVGFDGQSYADLPSIRRTVGLSLPGLRDHRTEVARRYSDLAAELGAPSLSAHVGFLPDRDGPDHSLLVQVLRTILDHCAANGQTLHLETGQESAAELLRLIRDVGWPNLGVNFDPGNFLLYGTDDPLPALEVLAGYVKGVHCKDGLRPDRPGALGTEVPLGRGGVDFPAFLRRLRELGYAGPLVIEREGGPDPVADVVAARAYLERLVREC